MVEMLQSNLSITAAITSSVPGCCISCITDRDAGVPEDDKGVIDREDHEDVHDMVEKDVLEKDNDILENEDYKEISNVTEKNIKRKFTRESREDSEEESVIEVIMSGEQQQGCLMLLTGSANYIYSYTKNSEPYQKMADDSSHSGLLVTDVNIRNPL